MKCGVIFENSSEVTTERTYSVKCSELFKVPSGTTYDPQSHQGDSGNEEEISRPTPNPPQ